MSGEIGPFLQNVQNNQNKNKMQLTGGGSLPTLCGSEP
jgi:hypothetical protein